MLHLTALHARRTGRKISVLFIDWEAQFSCTITHCEAPGNVSGCHRNDFGLSAANHAELTQPVLLRNGKCWEPAPHGYASLLHMPLPTPAIFFYTPG